MTGRRKFKSRRRKPKSVYDDKDVLARWEAACNAVDQLQDILEATAGADGLLDLQVERDEVRDALDSLLAAAGLDA